MVGYGTHGQPAGTLTDDTDLALCIARSLAEEGSFDGQDIADRFAEWYDDGPFDVGLMTADAPSEYQAGSSWRDAGREVWQRRAEGSNAGNGSIMRCAPHAVAFADDPDTLQRVSTQSFTSRHTLLAQPITAIQQSTFCQYFILRLRVIFRRGVH